MSDVTNALRQTLSNYGRLETIISKRGVAPPSFDLVAVHIETEEIDLSDVAARTTAFKRVSDILSAQEGWARCQSALVWFGMATVPDFESSGPPIMAEWQIDGSTSARLLPHPEGGARALIRTYIERPLGQSEPAPGEIACLRERIEVLAHVRVERATLVHHVFWGAGVGQPHHAIRRLFDRFVGFGDGET